MKKWIVALLAALVLLAGTALAEGHIVNARPIDPDFAAVHNLPEITFQARMTDAVKRFMASGDALSVKLVEASGNYYSGRTWVIAGSGGTGNYQYQFTLAAIDEDFDLHCVAHRGYSSDNSFTFAMLVPGTYRLYYYVNDGEHEAYRATNEIILEADGDHPELSDHVQAVVDACCQECSNDYDRALWLHDWLTANARYDTDYTYYGADGVLLRGRGTCDSYSKAYYLMLKAAGIGVDRVTSDQINHAWNLVKMEGEWYHVDVTWDDPVTASTGEGTLSGMEYHMYYGLPDELISADHKDGYDAIVPCTAYEGNYFIHTGRICIWTDSIRDSIDEALLEYRLSSTIDLPLYHVTESGDYYSSQNNAIVYGLSAYALGQMEWPLSSDAMYVDIHYDAISNSMPVRVRVTEEGTLELPSQVARIDDESFRNDTGFQAVFIEEGTSAIGANAFSGCGAMWEANIPDSVVEIDDTAFSDCPRLNIVCTEKNDYVIEYARRHGIRCVIEERKKEAVSR